MFKFDTHCFYTNGYTAGILPDEIADQCKAVIRDTKWADIDFHVKYPKWSLLENDSDADQFYEEKLRELKSLNMAPPEIRYIGDQILRLPYFNPLRDMLVKKQHRNISWIRSFTPTAYGLWNGQTDLPWHSDINDGADITILAYFVDEQWDKEWGGQIKIGVEDELGNVKEVYEQYPTDSTFIVINNMNPYFQHRVVQNKENKNRYTMSFRYIIE